MSGLSIPNVKTILDSIAKQAVNVKTLGFDANDTGYDNNRTTILAASSYSDFSAVGDLSGAFRQNVAVTIGTLWAGRFAALNTHLGGLSNFLTANDIRVDTALRDILGWSLPPADFFQSPVLASSTKLGSFVLSGAGTGTFTDGTAVDTNKFGKIWLTLKVTAPGGGVSTSIVVTITGKKLDGTTTSKVVTITGGAAAVGSHWPVGTLGTDADHFVDVTGISVTGGEATDAFDVESQLERVIAL